MARQTFRPAGNPTSQDRGTTAHVYLAWRSCSCYLLSGSLRLPDAGVLIDYSCATATSPSERQFRITPRNFALPDGSNMAPGVQADLHHVSMQQLETSVRVAFRQRGVSVHPSLNIRSEIEADSHFLKEQGANGGDLMVCSRCSLRCCSTFCVRESASVP